jgi:tRNA(Ser,Leu) C12 N-acetylase TAN1
VTSETATRLIVTSPAGLEAEARQELRRILPGASFRPLFLKGNLLARTAVAESDVIRRVSEADTTVIASVSPVQREVTVAAEAGEFADIVAAVAEIGRIRPGETFIVRCQRRGSHAWQGRDLEKAVAVALERLTGGVGEYTAQTDWHVTVQVFQDQGFVGVNRPEHMLRKELHRQRKYAPGERPLNRAQWKLREALEEFGIELPRAGRALDLGSAPGGWAAVLAGAVAEVVAVDPAELDPEVGKLPNLRHMQFRAEMLLEDPGQWGEFDIITSDMNRDPAEVADLMCKLSPLLRPGAPAIMTIKYVTPKRRRHEQEAMDRLAAEFEQIRIHRLPHNARETTAAMRRKGAVT